MKIVVVVLVGLFSFRAHAGGSQIERTCRSLFSKALETRHLWAAQEVILRRRVSLEKEETLKIAQRSANHLDTIAEERFASSIAKVARRVAALHTLSYGVYSKREIEILLFRFFKQEEALQGSVLESLLKGLVHSLVVANPFELRAYISQGRIDPYINKEANEYVESMSLESRLELINYLKSLNDFRIDQLISEVEGQLKEKPEQIAQRIYWAEDQMNVKVHSGLKPKKAKSKVRSHLMQEQEYPLDDVVLSLSLMSVVEAQKENFIDWIYSMDRPSSVKVAKHMDETVSKNSYYGPHIKKLHGLSKKDGQGSLWELRLRTSTDNLRIVYHKDSQGKVEFLTFGPRRDLEKLVKAASLLQKA